MKRTILVVLIIAMATTPCFAQEVEPDGIFSIDGTSWDYCRIVLGIGCGWICKPFVRQECDNMAFYQGDVYRCGGVCRLQSKTTYIDTPLVSIVYGVSVYFEFAILQPSGFGVYTGFGFEHGHRNTELNYSIGTMLKVDDDWSPHDQPIRCSDSSGCPDDMVCGVDFYCVNE